MSSATPITVGHLRLALSEMTLDLTGAGFQLGRTPYAPASEPVLDDDPVWQTIAAVREQLRELVARRQDAPLGGQE